MTYMFCQSRYVVPYALVAAALISTTNLTPAVASEQKIAGEPPFELSDPKRIKSGKSTFNSSCADYCHGKDPTLFMGRTGLDAEYVYNTIRDGGTGATPMPPWGDVFSHEEIWELIAYLKSIGNW